MAPEHGYDVEVWHLPCDLPSGTAARRRVHAVVWTLGGLLLSGLLLIAWEYRVITGLWFNAVLLVVVAATFAASFTAWRRGRGVVYFHPERVWVAFPAGGPDRREVELAQVERFWRRDDAFALYAPDRVVSFRLAASSVDDALEFLLDRLQARGPGCTLDVGA